VQRLSSGLRVSSSADGAAAMAQTETMRADKVSMGRAARNANEAISMLQTAEAGMASIGDAYVRMRELAVQAASDAITDDERGLLDVEYQELKDDIEQIAGSIEYNGQSLLAGIGGGAGGIVDADGDDASQFFFQIGFQNSGNNQLEVQIKTQVITQVQASGITSRDDARDAIDTIDSSLTASNGLLASRSNLGGAIATLHSAVDFAQTQSQVFETAIGGERDVDVGKESMEFTRGQVLQSAGIAMLAQANTQSNIALRLLG
jgi:flagellin